jgi:glutathione S-transferase
VARALRRAGVEFDVLVVPQRRSRRPEVVALSGQKRVPLLVLDGEVICDSRRIVQELELRRTGVSAPEQHRSSSDSAQDRPR